MQSGDKVNFVEAAALPANPNDATFYHIKDTNKLYLGSTLLSDNSPEIVARLEATVGHSSKNLFEITAQTSTNRGVTFTVDKQAGTVTTSGTATGGSAIFYMPISADVKGDYYLSGCAEGGTSSTYYIEGRDLTAPESKLPNWDGGNSANCYNPYQSRKIKIPQGHECALRIVFARNVNADGLVFRPMIRDGRIEDDSLEPYVTPTDEKKQDKSVVLWEATAISELSSTVIFHTSDIDYINYFIVYVRLNESSNEVVTHIVYNDVLLDDSNKYIAPSSYLVYRHIYEDTVFTAQSDSYDPKIIKIIGIPK